MNAVGRVGEETDKKKAIQGCSDEDWGGEHPLGACYTVAGSSGLEQKQLDQTSMDEGGDEEGREERWKASTAENKRSRNLFTVAEEQR